MPREGEDATTSRTISEPFPATDPGWLVHPIFQEPKLVICLSISPRRIFSGGSESTKEGLVGGSRVGGSGAEHPDAGVFKKFVKNQ